MILTTQSFRVKIDRIPISVTIYRKPIAPLNCCIYLSNLLGEIIKGYRQFSSMSIRSPYRCVCQTWEQKPSNWYFLSFNCIFNITLLLWVLRNFRKSKRGSQVLLFHFHEKDYPRAARSAPVKSYFFVWKKQPRAVRSAAVESNFFVYINKTTPEPRKARQSTPTFQFS